MRTSLLARYPNRAHLAVAMDVVLMVVCLWAALGLILTEIFFRIGFAADYVAALATAG